MNSKNLLKRALANSNRKLQGFNILFADEYKTPKMPWKQWQTQPQIDEDIVDYFRKMEEADYSVSCWGFICGYKGLQGIDFDRPWVYHLWKAEFDDRARTLTNQTPNGGFRPYFICKKPKTDDSFKESLHTELKGPGRFVAFEGKAKREDDSLGKYTVTEDLPILVDDSIVTDTLAFLEALKKRYNFLNWLCLRPYFSKKRPVNIAHNVRLVISDIMVYDGLSDSEIKIFFMNLPNFNQTKTEYQVSYTRHRVAEGLKPPTCATLRKMLTWNETDCTGCPRRKKALPLKAEKEKSQADSIVELVLANKAKLFHDEYNDAYVHIQKSDFSIIKRIRSRDFKIWMSYLSWEAEEKAPATESLSAAANILEAKARFEGSLHHLYNRVAPDPDGDGLWIDMTDDRWRAIKVTPQGWSIVENPPILFRRYNHQQPLPLPERGGNIKLFQAFINVDDEANRLLLLVCALTYFLPSIPHVILILYGIQGSAKTTLFKVIRCLVDPSVVPLLSIPKDERERVQQLAHHWCAFYDNVGPLPRSISDTFCRAATGGGFSKRELYSDDEDVIYNFRRCVGLNSINIAAQRPDVLDRSLLIGLKHIPKDKRKTEKEFWEEFEKCKGQILCGFLDVLVNAMKLYPKIKIKTMYRMADFTKWGCAISEALGVGKESFLSAYDENVRNQTEEAAHSSPVAEVLLKFMQSKEEWEGTPSQLYSELRKTAKNMGISRAQKAWPKSPNVLSRRLNELTQAILCRNLEVNTGIKSGSTRKVRINVVPAAPTVHTHGNNSKQTSSIERGVKTASSIDRDNWDDRDDTFPDKEASASETTWQWEDFHFIGPWSPDKAYEKMVQSIRSLQREEGRSVMTDEELKWALDYYLEKVSHRKAKERLIRDGIIHPTSDHKFLIKNSTGSTEAIYKYRQIPPAEKCEKCGQLATEYVITTSEGTTLRRCKSCFDKMRSSFNKVEFLREE